ncbi:hypothetical protein LEP1GSC041_2911 [Leptospira noguchii str. 2006001870]|nr:hypothetical protein LEP1GSC041_2911 [Leptospira noguchii str. 2006001870]
MYSSDLYAQNKIELQIKFKEKIRSISIEGENFSKRINAGSNLEVFLEIPKYGSYTILAENENGVLKKTQFKLSLVILRFRSTLKKIRMEL